jgi:hypothetical protein
MIEMHGLCRESYVFFCQHICKAHSMSQPLPPPPLPFGVFFYCRPATPQLSFKSEIERDRLMRQISEKFTELGPTKGSGSFLNFLGAPMILQKVYLLQLMPACVGFIMEWIAAYFCQSPPPPPNNKRSIIDQG